MSYALLIGAGVALYQANKQSETAKTGAFWAGQGGGGGGMFQGDFNVNLGGSGTAYQSQRTGDDGPGIDPVVLMAGALAIGGIYLLSQK